MIKTFVIVPTTVTKTEMKRAWRILSLNCAKNSKPSNPNWDGKKLYPFWRILFSSVTEITITNTKGRIQERATKPEMVLKKISAFLLKE